MEEGVDFDGAVGVSAGATFGCNIKSKQPGRAIRYNMRFARDSRYSGLWSLIRSGDYFNAQFAYHVVPHELDPFDDKAFEHNPMEFYAVCTDVETGQAVYKKLEKSDDTTYEWIRASASMPLASRVVAIEGFKLLDGGVADSIPLQFFENKGYNRNIVILTQPDGYKKEYNRLMPLLRMALRHYPHMVAALEQRHIMYNAELEYVKKVETESRCLVIRPHAKLPIGHISHDAEEMRHVYELGREAGLQHIGDIIRWYEGR